MSNKRIHWLTMVSILLLGAAGAEGQPGRSQQIYLPGVPFPDGQRLRIETLDTADVRGRESAMPSAGVEARAFASARVAATSGLPAGYSLGAGTQSALGAWTANEAERGRSIPAKLIALFPIRYRNVPLAKGSDVLSVVAPDGRLLALRRRGLPRAVDAVEPRVAVAAARESALADFGRIAGRGDGAAGEAELQIWVDADQGGHLAWHFVVASRTLSRPAAIEYYVSAVTGAVLARENAIYPIYNGRTTGTVWSASPFRPVTSVNLSSMKVTTPGLGTRITNSQGRFAFPGLFVPRVFSARLSGPFAVVSNQAGALSTVSRAGNGFGTLAIHFAAATDQARAQTSGFHWTNFARTFAQSIIAPGEPRLANLPVRVNISGACNAFWMSDPVHPTSNYFLAGSFAGNTCPNMAYADVVMHEFGHGVDQMNGGIIDGGYSEGFGDALSQLASRQSCAAREFFGPQTCLRDAATVVFWPFPPGTNVHRIGHAYSGFVWDLAMRLSFSMGLDNAFALTRQLIFAAAKMNPSSLPDAVQLSFLADDDDGNQFTCSPHFRLLAAAADSHGLPRPTCVGPAQP